MQEIWREIENYEGKYQISNKGRVWSNYHNIYMKQSDVKGYMCISLSLRGKAKNHKVHRLVALNFIKNECNKPYVNHIDEIKSNNHVDNLEWVTALENNTHGTRLERFKNTVKTSDNWQKGLVKRKETVKTSGKFKDGRAMTGKKLRVPVVGVKVSTGEKIELEYMCVETIYNFSGGKISECINGKRKTHKGYKWYKQ